MSGPLPVFGNAAVTAGLKKHLASVKRAVPITPTELTPYRDFTACGWTCTPVLANHDPSQQCLFYVLTKGDVGMLYATDTTWFPVKTFGASAVRSWTWPSSRGRSARRPLPAS